MSLLYSRWQQQSIIHALQTRRVVLLSGARQCGKTTLAKQLVKAKAAYRTLDDVAMRQLAQIDPSGFVKHSDNTLIIDEIQRVPELLSAIKMVVDENTRPGQYLLTGSANIQTLPSVQESLAGRLRRIRLRPLAQGELLRVEPCFLDKAFKQLFSGTAKGNYDRNTLIGLAFLGGFPEAIALGMKEAPQWHRDYITALLERDLQEIMRITRHQAMHDLVHTLAARSGKFMDISAISAGLSIRRPTLEAYINALEALYLVERVQPWTYTDYQRVGKQAKLYMADSGLMSALLGWHLPQVVFDSDRAGKLIETFVFNELAANVDASDGLYELFHYRDREQREIDFLIEREDRSLLGIEVKAGSSIGLADFKHLKWFKENIAKDRSFVGIVLYTGELTGQVAENLWAIPFAALWDN